MLKRIIAILCVAGVILSVAGCGKKDDTKQDNPAVQNETREPAAEPTMIEDGGEIDDEGNVINSSSEVQIPATSEKDKGTAQTTDTGIETEELNIYAGIYEQLSKITPEFDANGNISQSTAVAILGVFPAEMMGLDGEVEYQMLFAADKETIDNKMCYSIVAKRPEGETEGVFLVALDGSAAYKYDLSNYRYIKIL